MSFDQKNHSGGTRAVSRVLVLPGYQNSGEGHWQTRWEALDPRFVRVQMPDWEHAERAAWCQALDDAVAAADAPVKLAAHSLGCLTIVFWATQVASPAQRAKVAGALLVAPPDPNGPDFPSTIRGYTPLPKTPLPFATSVVASSDDPYASLGFAQACAAAWGAACIDVGRRGHINSTSGLGDWAEGRAWLDALG